MIKSLYIGLGFVATMLAIAGAVLPGLPTTPFLLVALWAFARSSPALTAWLHHIPILRAGLREAERFEQRRAIRPAIKATALSFAWGSVSVTGYFATSFASALFLAVLAAAIAATAFMLWVATDRE